MCVVSNIGDDWKRRWPNEPYNPWKELEPLLAPKLPEVTKEEFNALKKEIEALKELLTAAKKYDEQTGQPNCEMDDKVTLIKKIAEFVGVDMSKVF